MKTMSPSSIFWLVVIILLLTIFIINLIKYRIDKYNNTVLTFKDFIKEKFTWVPLATLASLCTIVQLFMPSDAEILSKELDQFAEQMIEMKSVDLPDTLLNEIDIKAKNIQIQLQINSIKMECISNSIRLIYDNNNYNESEVEQLERAKFIINQLDLDTTYLHSSIGLLEQICNNPLQMTHYQDYIKSFDYATLNIYYKMSKEYNSRLDELNAKLKEIKEKPTITITDIKTVNGLVTDFLKDESTMEYYRYTKKIYLSLFNTLNTILLVDSKK